MQRLCEGSDVFFRKNAPCIDLKQELLHVTSMYHVSIFPAKFRKDVYTEW